MTTNLLRRIDTINVNVGYGDYVEHTFPSDITFLGVVHCDRRSVVLMTAHSRNASVSSLTFGIYRCIDGGVVPEDEPGRPLQFVGVVADGLTEPSAVYVRRDV